MKIKNRDNLEKVIKDWSPDAKKMIRQIWKCNNLDDLKELVFRWDEEGLFRKIDKG